MTPFRFRLQRVLEFRRMKFQLAESACRRAEARLGAIQAHRAALAAGKSETRNSVARLPSVAGNILEPLTSWLHWTETEAHRLMQAEQAVTQDLQKRHEALVEAHRSVRLLEKLYDLQHADWQRAYDREVEETAADAIHCRFIRSRLV
jgi:flagellar biosynthesis chaperone FliJ